tara:strand:- start:203 stop:385 length:183 start_codon:yes stop_codon:yes gene_type:complete
MPKMTKRQMHNRLKEAASKCVRVALMWQGPAGNYSTLSRRDREKLVKYHDDIMAIAEKLK